ncbi:TonB-dependent receptor plug domain-containing protein [Sphingomonas sp.]|uniref:TonB-dependent receptor plug domain-containing protein n=1 Tax=Sphingomonas sp. TaxID=28214 RepID=UPI003B0052B1
MINGRLLGQAATTALATFLAASASLAQTGSPAVGDPAHEAQGQAPAGTTSDAPSPIQQSSEGVGGDIIVTGSRIRHSPIEQPQPVTFVDQADIARTGLSSIADVLQRLPTTGGGLNTRNNSSGNLGNPPDGGGVGAGSSEINLRTLGSKRTLVLVDSMRFINGSAASGIPAAVDLNAIPQSAIERVEVLQDGASAIYGSDAIAGVVNIITKTKQDGLVASAQHGLFKEGDGFTQNYDVSYGFAIPSIGTQIVFGGDYVQQDPVFAGDRAFAAFPAPFTNACTSSCSSATPNGRFITPFGSQTLIAPVVGRAPTLTDYRAFTTPDRYNFQPTNYLLTPYKRYGGFLNLEQPLGGDVKFSGKFFYNRRESENQAAPLPLFIGPDSGNSNLLDTINISASNPYNPFGDLIAGGVRQPDGTVSQGNYSFVARRLTEGGPRHYSQRVNTYYGTATLSGQFRLFQHNWYWDVNGVFGKTNASQSVTGNVNAANVQRALGPLADCTAPCVPLNIFGGQGALTPEMYNYIAFTQHDRSSQQLADGTANLTGQLLDLPAGPLGVALGYEHRAIRGSFTPDPLIQAGLGADIPAAASRGHYHSDEAYGELSVPVLKDKPFFELLNVSFAMRYSDYSATGSKTTFKAGGDWKPTRDLVLRGTYAQGFRAPAIAELFGSPSRFDDPANDPCNDITNDGSTLARDCAAAGVPLTGGYEQNNNQLPVFTSGNRNLKPETSRSWVGGGVYSATWARSFAQVLTLEASYFNIKVKSAIGAIDTTTRLNSCYVDGDPSACAAVTRSATGQITRIDGTLLNLSSLRTKGIDLNFNFRSADTGAGTFGLNWANTMTFSYDQTVPTDSGTQKVKRVGTESGSQAYPRYKSVAIGSWSLENFTFSLTGRYISGVKEAGGDMPGHTLGRRLYGDLQLLWDTKLAHRDFSLAVGVNNLAGTAPPACYVCLLNNYDPTTYDLPGQFFYVRAGIKI